MENPTLFLLEKRGLAGDCFKNCPMDVFRAVFVLNEVVGQFCGGTAPAYRAAVFSDTRLDWSSSHSDIEFFTRTIH